MLLALSSLFLLPSTRSTGLAIALCTRYVKTRPRAELANRRELLLSHNEEPPADLCPD